ncbi:MAG: bifunctional 4-hydroxy-2-oxoglutarate aldolase/2-dehydro-3-deoxy-phosphogluconate aldolase [Eubacteriales bacterium]|nr:bifunctional 4-hydroxy-2-oxoglutarate aldolase/2-dehydro-3-deoxy-phosphogluconate aldolase [Eubacteriales bacterium]
MDMLDKLSLAGLVPVIKVEKAEDAVPLCEALDRGGLPVAEITFRTAAAEQAIRNVHAQRPDILLGAGTVLTTEQVDRAIDAGAGYIVSPGFNPAVVQHCGRRGIAVLPGCANPSDIEMALSMGIETIKFFPAEALGGLGMIKALAAPYTQVRFVPTGGINEKNFLDYLAFPKVRAVGGSWMVPDDAVVAGDGARIEHLTRSAISKMLGMEVLGLPPRGERGPLSIGVNDMRRARWHLERRGYRFGGASETAENGKPVAHFLQDDIAHFSLRLEQK